jgi:hypothetical protein
MIQQLIAAVTMFWVVPGAGDINKDKVVYLYEQRCGPDGVNGQCTRTIIGGWRLEDDTYHRYLGGKFEIAESKCPTDKPPDKMLKRPLILPPPPKPPEPGGVRPNFGIGPPGEAVAKPKDILADDSAMPRLTIRGERVVLPSGLASCVLLWCAPADHWSMVGFTEPATLTTADGTILYAGVIDFDRILAALEPPRKPNTPEPPLAGSTDDPPYGVLTVAGILVLLFLRAKR